MSTSVELQIGHVFDGNRICPKNSCFRAFPMYCPVRNFSMLVIWESVIFGFFQNAVEDFACISGLEVYLFMLRKFCARVLRLFSRLYSVRYAARFLTGPLSGL